jgi:hypothetical protein
MDSPNYKGHNDLTYSLPSAKYFICGNYFHIFLFTISNLKNYIKK